MGRSALFGDPTVIRRLKTEFIPCGAKRLELEQRPGLREWWVPLVSALKPQWRPGYTSQGSYVIDLAASQLDGSSLDQLLDSFNVSADDPRNHKAALRRRFACLYEHRHRCRKAF